MSKIKLTGDLSGYVELSAANNAGNKTLELPTDGDKILSNNNVGIVTATTFSGNLDGTSSLAQGLTGTPDITVGNINATGTITYDDVTNIDSVGVITARSGIDVTGGVITSDDYTITGISSSITDTAVDVFIYDTSKDSDGGAWRKRTQHTSWYNETLNTATRGSRKEFPAVAVIVAESTQLTIYDGDDPDMPMWMLFDGGSYTDFIYGLGNGPVTSIQMLNAKLCVTINDPSNQGGLDIVDFISDTGHYINESVGGPYRSKGNIKTRNDGLNLLVDKSFYSPIVSRYPNDVAMTVLPNARVDVATGLPVPTIAVATNGGVSTIKDDGTVASTQRGANEVHSITFDEDYSQIFSWGTTSGFPRHITRLPIELWSTSSTSSSLWTNNYFSSGNEGAGTAAASTTTADGGFVTVANSGRHFGIEYGTGGNTDDRLVIFHPLNMTNNANQNLSAFITSSYNTGWMHGDIKGAFLSDTTIESLTANTNLASSATQVDTGRLTSETYDNGDTSWQMVDNSGSANGYLTIRFSGLTVGQTYIISMTWDNNAALDAGYNHRIDHNSGGSTNFTQWNKTNGSSETNTGIFVATSENNEELVFYANAITLNVSNFNIRELDDKDRSVNNKGLQVVGTITKSAVATGADLVGYSGFSGSNVLIQPYNTDLNPGTGNYSFMCWFKCSSTGGEQMIMRRFGVPTVTGGMMMRIVQSSSLLQWYVRDTSSTATGVNSTEALDDGNWHCAVGTREGSTARLYIDGKLNSSSSCSGNSHNPGTTADLVIGAEESSGSPGTYQNPADLSSLALVRYSLSAPTAIQIKKMYEDERHLFQENAACTLYGSSDLVTALTYDEVIDRLHVGTSSGRSDFQALRRINNTTTAVTTAISAHDEFIVEQ